MRDNWSLWSQHHNCSSFSFFLGGVLGFGAGGGVLLHVFLRRYMSLELCMRSDSKHGSIHENPRFFSLEPSGINIEEVLSVKVKISGKNGAAETQICIQMIY